MIAQYSRFAPVLLLLAAQLINCQQGAGPSPAEAQQQQQGEQQLGNFIINPPSPEELPLSQSQSPPPQQPASSVWFQANNSNLNSNHIDPRHEQPNTINGGGGDGLRADEDHHAHQANEHMLTHPMSRVAHRAELGRLERRVDRLEFELRKSLHQIQLLNNESPDARAPIVDSSATGQQIDGNRRTPALGQGDKDDQQESARRTSQSAGGGGTILSSGNSDIKLIDLSERLNLVEKFITITTSKMYEMEQSLRQLERCECRMGCKWPAAAAASSLAQQEEEEEDLGHDEGNHLHDGAQHKTQHQWEQHYHHSSYSSPPETSGPAPRHPPNYSQMNETITQQRPNQRRRRHVLKADGQIWQDERNKCNVCSCHRGHVDCKRAACPELKCDNPQQVPGKCCPVCLKSCTFKQRLVKHGHKLVINSNEQTCKECLCSDGRLKCQRVDRAPSQAPRMQRNAVNDDLYDGMYDDEYDDPEAVSARRVASPLEENDQYDGSNDLDEDEQDLKTSNEQTTRTRVKLVKREASDRTHSISERSRRGKRRASAGAAAAAAAAARANELEEDDRPNGGQGQSYSTSTTTTTNVSPRAPLFCPLVDCEPRDQFKLENDCCTYCRGFDFCSYDFHRTWSTTRDDLGSRQSRRCHANAKCTNTNIYETLLASSLGNTSATSLGESQNRKLTINSMFACECAPGFTGDGTDSCQDIDECASSHLNDCEPKTTRCVNTLGSYECQCRAGFKPAHGGAHHHNHLHLHLHQVTHRKGRTVPVVQAGERRLLQRCVDVNECADGKLNGCHTQARCVNTLGSYRCHCRRGYLGNGFECHKWFTSGPNVAAYLHRHTQGDNDEKKEEEEGAEESGAQSARLVSALVAKSANQTADHRHETSARARVALPPLNTLDEDDEQDDDQSDLLPMRGYLDSSTETEDQLTNEDDDDMQEELPPKLSESKWEPLKFGFDFFGSATTSGPLLQSQQQQQQQQLDPSGSPAANETDGRAGGDRPQESPSSSSSSSSFNTRTMFFQPPPPIPRPRPWWDEEPTTTTTTITTTTATTTEPSAAAVATDVTEKQTTRLVAAPDAAETAASQQSPNQSDITRTDPAWPSSLSKQGGTITPLADGTTQPTKPTTPNQAMGTKQPGPPRRGTIIASASTSSRRGGSPSNGRAYLSSQHQHYKSSAAPSLLTSSILTRPFLERVLLTPTATIILSLLVLLFSQQLYCIQINHIVTVYSF